MFYEEKELLKCYGCDNPDNITIGIIKELSNCICADDFLENIRSEIIFNACL